MIYRNLPLRSNHVERYRDDGPISCGDITVSRYRPLPLNDTAMIIYRGYMYRSVLVPFKHAEPNLDALLPVTCYQLL